MMLGDTGVVREGGASFIASGWNLGAKPSANKLLLFFQFDRPASRGVSASKQQRQDQNETPRANTAQKTLIVKVQHVVGKFSHSLAPPHAL